MTVFRRGALVLVPGQGGAPDQYGIITTPGIPDQLADGRFVGISGSGNPFRVIQIGVTQEGTTGNDILPADPWSGNDFVEGGAGFDTAVFSGPSSAYTIQRNGSSILVSGPGGTDTLRHVERLVFDDRNVIGSADGILTLGDFNGDGTDDLAWRNVGNAKVQTWLLDQGHVEEATTLGAASLPKQALGSGDFNGDGTDDLAWRNPANAEVQIWTIRDGGLRSVTTVGAANEEWEALAPGDFNGDGTDDLAWRDADEGYVELWFMNRGRLGSTDFAAGLGGEALATGDFNGDGTDDLAWRYGDTVKVWTMQNGDIASVVTMSGAAGSNWHSLGSADLTGDGTDDFLWRNGTSGEIQLWETDADRPGRLSSATKLGAASLKWQFLGDGDIDGDHTNDLLWRNVDTGAVQAWTIDGGHVVGTVALGAAGGDWFVIG